MDHQIFQAQNYGGISRYFLEILKQSYNDNEISLELALAWSANEYLESRDFSSHSSFGKDISFRGKSRLIRMINEWNSLSKLQGADLLHATYYDTYFLDKIRCPFVITVHDMINELASNYFIGHDPIPENKKTLIHKASKIIAVSKATKNDILKLYDIPEDKVEVIYHAPTLDDIVSIPLDTPKRYILYIGKRQGYKNFDVFYEGVKTLLNNDLSLICAGGGVFSKLENERFAADNTSDYIKYYDISDNRTLKTLYEKASLFVYPSFYEGFGIPILEAMNSSCPVALSDIAVFREVAGDAAYYFDPHSQDDLKEKIKQGLSGDLRTQQFKERVSLYTWEKSYQQTKDVYLNI